MASTKIALRRERIRMARVEGHRRGIGRQWRRQVRRMQRRIGYEESADVHAVVPIATPPASPQDRSCSMRATKLTRAIITAALFVSATFTAACAVEDEGVVDELSAEELVAEDSAALKDEETAQKAGSVTSYCDSRTTVWTSRSTATVDHAQGSSASGPWTVIGRGREFTRRSTVHTHVYVKIGTQVVAHPTACNRPGNPGDPQDPR
jgi:hypothetical protein